jgi:subtilase family protein
LRYSAGRVDLSTALGRLFGSGQTEGPRPLYAWLLIRPPLAAADVHVVSAHCPAHDLAALLQTPRANAALIRELGLSDAQVRDMEDLAPIHYFAHFPLIGFLTMPDDVATLRALPFVEHVNTVSLESAVTYLRIVKGLHVLMDRNDVYVTNMSLQPLSPYPYDAREAMSVATNIVTQRGITIVFAAGNFGLLGNGSMNPWSLAPWVVSVGAADAAGTMLWKASSRGRPGDPNNHPTIVAPGIDVVAARAGSATKQRPHDPLYTKQTGTSFATAHISGVIACAQEFIRDALLPSPKGAEWTNAVHDAQPVRTWFVDGRAAVIKRMLVDMAVPMPHYGTHEVGAGFVSDRIAQAYFRNFSFSNFVKVFRTE